MKHPQCTYPNCTCDVGHPSAKGWHCARGLGKPATFGPVFREHLSHPGFGWIAPWMDPDQPLIARETAETIIAVMQDMRDGYRSVDWYHACADSDLLNKVKDW